MTEQEQYMQDFLYIFSALECWGPGSEEETKKAYYLMGFSPQNILELGCGKGNSTMVLAKVSKANIVAIDSEQSALDKLNQKIQASHLSSRVSVKCMDMAEFSVDKNGFSKNSVDLIWAEASLYVVGVCKALINWRPLLQENGLLVFSDLVWLSEAPSAEAKDFWLMDYPDMKDVNQRLSEIKKAGYHVEETFTMSEEAWKNYYEPLQQRIDSLTGTIANSQAARDITREINVYKKYLGEFAYQFFIVRKASA
ncbi:class I SAM-dependent methyltransferase [Glaciecola petra]|uniref:Class I SAM-dependent methyltransferase n=1 Tax=Glaciecola petra TaxID=3075602 RepID=A0ABU2ZW34_9ALTE|nr:class I SAM-dependent methyltransferase [Aestuariibacter sp. P117]MDT0596586.1 class I SAM-dependent methyltransferase [Aestuariibacter sp. P117]